MSIATELTRIATAKAAIKSAINAKGGSLTTETLDDYAAAISAIQTGGGGGGGGGSFYKCASVGSGTWTGYKAVWNSTASKYEFESSLTSDALTFTLVTPSVNKIYSADALINASLWNGIPTAGLVLHASLTSNQSTAETGQTITNNGGIYETSGGIPCVRLNGSSKLSIAWNSITGNSPRTLSAWIRPISKVSSTSWNSFIYYGYNDLRQWFALSYDDSNRLSFAFFMDDLPLITPVMNTWYHVVGMYDGESAYGYINGVQQAIKSISLNTCSGALIIGTNMYNEYSNCCIAGVRIYNRALSAAEIDALAGEFTPTA